MLLGHKPDTSGHIRFVLWRLAYVLNNILTTSSSNNIIVI